MMIKGAWIRFSVVTATSFCHKILMIHADTMLQHCNGLEKHGELIKRSENAKHHVIIS
jgi:hypothetical protein